MADPVFADGRADMFFSSPEDDRPSVEEVIEGVGLRPVYVGEDQEALVDALFQLWIALASQTRTRQKACLSAPRRLKPAKTPADSGGNRPNKELSWSMARR